MKINVFCGDCCMDELEIESSSEAVSDDEVWVKNYGAEITTPAISPPTTDPVQSVGTLAV